MSELNLVEEVRLLQHSEAKFNYKVREIFTFNVWYASKILSTYRKNKV